MYTKFNNIIIKINIYSSNISEVNIIAESIKLKNNLRWF
jgi:hypothetical protein